ncbi:MAG: trypsin-like serine protease [Crocinitomix sp.]|nr:trypsin-like serine protease [Crocinitomix sp.]
MKRTFLKITTATFIGVIAGAFTVLSFTNKQDQVIVSSAETVLEAPATISPVAFTNRQIDNDCDAYADLTPASEKGVETVVHITTEFIREEITYDPFLQLFYGEDAYKTRKRHGMASGSGVIVSPEGYIVTNNHVVQDAHKITISLDGNKYNGELVGTDPSTDLAVIKINKSNLKYLEFADSDDLRLGEWVLAIGNPLNLQTTITAGIVSAKNRNIDLLAGNYNPEEGVFPVESFIQTDAAVNSGNSGGALVNQQGELVGINTAIASGNGFYTGYSFAIPSNIVKKVTYDLIQHGEVKRVQLGVNIMQNNREVAKSNQLATEKGVVITAIVNGGNAASADVKTKDVILSVGNKSIASINELQAEIAVHQPGDQINLGIMRGQELKNVSILLK